jgi:hypothetical protein
MAAITGKEECICVVSTAVGLESFLNLEQELRIFGKRENRKNLY